MKSSNPLKVCGACATRFTLGSLLGLLLCWAPVQSAQLIINVDGPSKLITASGTISGTTDVFGSVGGLAWDAFGPPSVDAQHDVSSLLNLSGPAVPFGSNVALWGFQGWNFSWDSGNPNSGVTISATGASIDYSGWSAADIAAVESSIGATGTSIDFGTSSDSFLITGTPSPPVSAIPEPGSAGTMAAILGFCLLARRRIR